MPTITTERGEEISVSMHLVAKLAERMHRMAPERRTHYLAGARRRLAAGGRSRDDAAAVLAAGD
jgi:hypothetical protein